MDLRFELCKPFGGLRKETLDELEQIAITYAKEYHTLQLLQTGVISSACNEYIEGINMQCARCDEPKYKHKF